MCFPGNKQDIQHAIKSKFLMQKCVDALKPIYDEKMKFFKGQVKTNYPGQAAHMENPNSPEYMNRHNLAIKQLREENLPIFEKIAASQSAVPPDLKERILAQGGEAFLNKQETKRLWKYRDSLLDDDVLSSTLVQNYCKATNQSPEECIKEWQYHVGRSLSSVEPILAKSKKQLNDLEKQRLEEVTRVNIALGNAIPDLPASALVRAEVRRILLEAGVEPSFAQAISERPSSLHGMISYAINEMDVNQAHFLVSEGIPDLRNTLARNYPTQKQAVTSEADARLSKQKAAILLQSSVSVGLFSLNLMSNYALAQAGQTFAQFNPWFGGIVSALTLSGLGIKLLRNRSEAERDILKGASGGEERRVLLDLKNNAINRYQRVENIIALANYASSAVNVWNAMGAPAFQNWWTGNSAPYALENTWGLPLDYLNTILNQPGVFTLASATQALVGGAAYLTETSVTNVMTTLWTLPKAVWSGGLLMAYKRWTLGGDPAGTVSEILITNSTIPTGIISLGIAVAAFYLFNGQVRTEFERIYKKYYPEHKILFAGMIWFKTVTMASQLWPFVTLSNNFTNIGLELSVEQSSNAINEHFQEMNLNLKQRFWERVKPTDDQKSFLSSLKDTIWNQMSNWRIFAPNNPPPFSTPLEAAIGAKNPASATKTAEKALTAFNENIHIYDSTMNRILHNATIEARNELCMVKWRPEDYTFLSALFEGSSVFGARYPYFMHGVEVCMSQLSQVQPFVDHNLFGLRS